MYDDADLIAVAERLSPRPPPGSEETFARMIADLEAEEATEPAPDPDPVETAAPRREEPKDSELETLLSRHPDVDLEALRPKHPDLFCHFTGKPRVHRLRAFLEPEPESLPAKEEPEEEPEPNPPVPASSPEPTPTMTAEEEDWQEEPEPAPVTRKKDGWMTTQFPTTLMRGWTTLDLKPVDLHVILAVRTFWRPKNNVPPYPSIQTIADMIGVSRSTVERSLRRMEKKGYLRKGNVPGYPRGMKPRTLDFSGLWDAADRGCHV